MNFSFIWKTSLQIHDMLKDAVALILDQKSFQELMFEAVKNRKRSS